MLLLIERLREEVVHLKEEIEKLQNAFRPQCSTEIFDKKIQEMEQGLKEFEGKKKIQEIKVQKFQRDRKNYSQEKVYPWMPENKKRFHGPVQLKLTQTRKPQMWTPLTSREMRVPPPGFYVIGPFNNARTEMIVAGGGCFAHADANGANRNTSI